MLNQADCIDKIRSSLFSCNKNDYVPTKEEIEIMTARYTFNLLLHVVMDASLLVFSKVFINYFLFIRKEKARASILVEKKRQSLVKRARAIPDVQGI